MRILHVTQGYSPAVGGTERVIQRLSEELVRGYGDEVTVFTTNCFSGEAFYAPASRRMPVGSEEIAGVAIRRFPVWARVSRLFQRPQRLAFRLNLPLNQHLRTLAQGPIMRGLRKAMLEVPTDLIVASSFPLLHMQTSLRVARTRRLPCILIGGLHPQDDWGFERGMIYEAIRRANHYIAYTDFEADYVISRGAQPGRVTAIGLGVDPEPFTCIPQDEARRRLGFPADAPIVGFIGQLGFHKGVDTLMQAMPEVWRVIPNARVLIAGVRTMFAAQLEAYMKAWPAADRQKVVLRYDFPENQKPWLFAAVDVFAYPSGYESFGIAFLEAWAAGKPVIGCRRGAVSSVVSQGRDGLLVGYHQSGALADAIILLMRNPKWARALAARGHDKVMESYTWTKVVERFREVYVRTAGPLDNR